jgi:DNA-binding NtrC family response regulator
VAYEKPILLVDDEEGVVELLADYLETEALVSIKCTDPQKVLHLIESNPIEVVVLDYFMPGKDGLVLLREINDFAGKSGRPLQVIMLTAQVDSKVALELLRNHAFLYMNKPPKFRDFLKAVHSAAGKYAQLSTKSDKAP